MQLKRVARSITCSWRARFWPKQDNKLFSYLFIFDGFHNKSELILFLFDIFWLEMVRLQQLSTLVEYFNC